jgi:PilZ domain
VESYRETRKSMRFPVEARVVYKWIDETGTQREAEGRTLNISEHGALVCSQANPPKGAAVQLKVFLPPVPMTLSTLPILMDARVVRVEKPEAGQELKRFAVEARAIQIRESKGR